MPQPAAQSGCCCTNPSDAVLHTREYLQRHSPAADKTYMAERSNSDVLWPTAQMLFTSSTPSKRVLINSPNITANPPGAALIAPLILLCREFALFRSLSINHIVVCTEGSICADKECQPSVISLRGQSQYRDTVITGFSHSLAPVLIWDLNVSVFPDTTTLKHCYLIGVRNIFYVAWELWKSINLCDVTFWFLEASLLLHVL